MDQDWHKACFKCAECDDPLFEKVLTQRHDLIDNFIYYCIYSLKGSRNIKKTLLVESEEIFNI